MCRNLSSRGVAIAGAEFSDALRVVHEVSPSFWPIATPAQNLARDPECLQGLPLGSLTEGLRPTSVAHLTAVAAEFQVKILSTLLPLASIAYGKPICTKPNVGLTGVLVRVTR
jgi:hypothetical protein